GREVPPGGLPAAVGCAVFNPETCAAVWRAVTTGLPLVTCSVTVSGSAVANPKNLICRVGTPIESLFAAAGGFREDPYKMILGGPMMGSAVYSLDLPVLKTTNSLLAFSRDEDKFAANPTCIHCGRCIKACPMHLMPMYLNMYYNKGMIRELDELHVTDCIECGSCAYVCPGRLPLTQVCRAGKARLNELKRKEAAK
ncbi:MAG: SLBB domain-containing protein, partial [Firmicutes bacterium]|nr:SLBB domain-containing protein [Bacillota bacterium]